MLITDPIPSALVTEMRGDLVRLFVAAITLAVGAASITLGVARRPRDRALVSFGLTGGLYGIRLLLMLHTVVAALSADAAAPGRMLSGMSQIIHRRLRTQFITAVYLSADLDAGCLRWASAGHPSPLLLRYGAVQELASPGPILGRFAPHDYVESSIALEPDDRVLVFSDGIPEALSPSGEPFGDERLQAFLIEHGSPCRWLGRRAAPPARSVVATPRRANLTRRGRRGFRRRFDLRGTRRRHAERALKNLDR